LNAHVPVLEGKNDSSSEKPWDIPRPYDKSIAYYGYLEGGDSDVFQFEVTANDLSSGSQSNTTPNGQQNPLVIYFGTLVPYCEHYRTYLLELTLRNQTGQILTTVSNTEQGREWYEPYSRHRYYWQKDIHFPITQPGVYSITLRHPEGRAGDYVFAFGEKEMWGFYDVLNLIWVYPKLLFKAEIRQPGCG